MYGQKYMHVIWGGNCGNVLFCAAHSEKKTKKKNWQGMHTCTLERDRKWAFSENLCHQTLSLSNVNTQEINIAWKIGGYNCFYWFIVWAKELFDVFKGPS